MAIANNIYSYYFGTKSEFSTNTMKMKVPEEKLIETITKEKQMLANLILSELGKEDNFVEFSYAAYRDGELFPTISSNLADKGKNVTLISPNVRTTKENNGLSTIRTSIENPFYVYDEYVSPKLKQEIKNVGCFITEINHSRLMNHFKTWAGLGIPCVFTMAGQLGENFKNYSEEITKMFKQSTKDNFLEYKVYFDYNTSTNSVAKIYTLKRK